MYKFELEMNRSNLNSGNIIKKYLRKNLWNKNYIMILIYVHQI